MSSKYDRSKIISENQFVLVQGGRVEGFSIYLFKNPDRIHKFFFDNFSLSQADQLLQTLPLKSLKFLICTKQLNSIKKIESYHRLSILSSYAFTKLIEVESMEASQKQSQSLDYSVGPTMGSANNLTCTSRIPELKHYKIALEKEKEILSRHIKIGSELIIKDIPILLNGITTFIHTYFVPAIDENPEAETIVLLHGFGGNGLSFAQMFKSLSQHFNIFTMDFIGMGLSDRQEFKIEHNPRAVVDFFVDSVEQWRIQLNLSKFMLTGHSFGGYIAGNYSLRFPDRVSEVFLLSPMATTQIAPEEDLANEENYKAYLKNLPFKNRMIVKFIRCQTEKQKMTPGRLLDKWFIPANYLLEKAVGNRLKITEKSEVELWKGFLRNSMSLPQSTEHYIHDLLTFPRVQAKFSFEEAVAEQEEMPKTPFYVMFGDDDWMNPAGCKRLFEQKKLNGKFIIIQDAGHQLPFDQPAIIANKIINLKFPATI